MKVLVLGHLEVLTLLPMARCIELMDQTLRALSAGETVQPLRSRMQIPGGKGLLNLMPAYLGTVPVAGAKVISVFHGNTGTPYESHQGPVLLFEPENGCLVAMVDAAALTATRTAAASGVATRLLAREGGVRLALIGSGTQADLHVAAMRAVRPISQLRVWSRSESHAQQFAQRMQTVHGLEVEVAHSVRDAVLGADVVCTVTASNEPILNGEWLGAGAHVNAVGASAQGRRELDALAVERARVFVDARASAEQEADELLLPIAQGRIGPEHVIGEIGEVLLGRVQGRRSPEEITIFKSLGLAVEDLAAAYEVYAMARERGLGTYVEFSGGRSL